MSGDNYLCTVKDSGPQGGMMVPIPPIPNPDGSGGYLYSIQAIDPNNPAPPPKGYHYNKITGFYEYGQPKFFEKYCAVYSKCISKSADIVTIGAAAAAINSGGISAPLSGLVGLSAQIVSVSNTVVSISICKQLNLSDIITLASWPIRKKALAEAMVSQLTIVLSEIGL